MKYCRVCYSDHKQNSKDELMIAVIYFLVVAGTWQVISFTSNKLIVVLVR